MLLGLDEILPVVVQRAEVDVSCSVLWLELDDLQVNADSFVVIAGVFFQSDSAGK